MLPLIITLLIFVVYRSPKATVQAALASAPLDLILRNIEVGDPKRDRWVQWGEEIEITAALIVSCFWGERIMGLDDYICSIQRFSFSIRLCVRG